MYPNPRYLTTLDPNTLPLGASLGIDASGNVVGATVTEFTSSGTFYKSTAATLICVYGLGAGAGGGGGFRNNT